jgi:signal transduction histidine kinase/ActR/RegA family two-component response regulator
MSGEDAAAAPDELHRTVIGVEQDVFVVRHRGREAAAALGLDRQDQVRVATALSEVGRQMFLGLGMVEVVFEVVRGRPGLLGMHASAALDPTDDAVRLTRDLEPASRLMDVWAVETSGGRFVVRMGRRLTNGGAGQTEVAKVRRILDSMAPATPLQELAEQNRQLLASLVQIQAQRDELLALNAELEETNRGVMALYGQLSEELAETNRGVVALYAELDQKSELLRATSDAKTRFLANVSHELRAPATAIIGLLRLLMDRRSDPLTDEQRHQLELIRRSARDLLDLVNQLLDLAKAESGRLEPRWTDVDVAAMFDTVRGTMQSLVTSPAVTLVVEPPASNPSLVSDEALLSQVLRNLLTNAIKFTTEGEVRLAAVHRPDDDAVEFVVTDTGVGIAAAEQERVFEEFYQARTTAHLGAKGTGLGLPYARRLVTILGGSMRLDSAVGRGTTVTVRLPTRPRDGRSDDRPLTVMVIDDDDTFREAVGGVLRDAGMRVVQTSDGRVALAAMTQHRPDAIVLDLRLPEMDGTILLDALSEDADLRGVPVVILTAFPGELTPSPVHRANAVLEKVETPIDDLPAIIRSIVAAAQEATVDDQS